MAKPSTGQRSITMPRGFRAAAATSGLKPSGDPDLALIVSDMPCQAAGLFTRNKFPGEPVKVARRHLRRGEIQAIVCNSGIANVATGRRGQADALAMAEHVAKLIGVETNQVLPSSTGIIGRFLPMDKVRRGIELAFDRLGRGRDADTESARAILTTDLVAKAAYRTIKISKTTVRIGGIAKGSGMIAPHMATMLAFITTDAAIVADALRQSLRQAVDGSFNRISIDQDTSTSDSVFVLASGEAANRLIKPSGRSHDAFTAVLTDLCRDLAYQIVRDGEGATKVFRVKIRGALSQRDADRVGKSVVNSPLVKTAVHGGDPNWGRLIMAVGRSGAAVTPGKLSIKIGSIPVCRRGQAVDLRGEHTRKLTDLMNRFDLQFEINLGLGQAKSEWLGCDLSRKYVEINADYTT